ncbi:MULTISPECIES: enoyl-CoA hydratase/isomerase family protein [unclassified Pseudonocardia]|uniref:enoyl-CoA hydratase/isomerase family protein n=1 Tax=unclassified Pseudonocardia TaxID=2619320 RepID=UPI000705B358|nr:MULTISPECIES: enoyl-CoA hydratase/isomerase family protein [unclassified Pseudonocardia]ALL85830.1 hypothetical protein AD017_32260 [Pseudonocardia sp. EC080619-01]
MLKSESVEHITWLTLDNPPANALNNPILRELVSSLDEINRDSSVRGVVLTGSGNRFFCAGGDVKEFISFDEAAGLERVALGSRLKSALGRMECPLAIAVNGVAVGSGMEMAAFADFCVASSTARFGMPEINHGLLPMAKGIQQLIWLIGWKNTKEVLFTGEIFDAVRAQELGLAHEVVEPDRVAERAEQWITTMAAKPPELFRALKRTVLTSVGMEDQALEKMTQADFLTYFRSAESDADLRTLVGDRQSPAATGTRQEQ